MKLVGLHAYISKCFACGDYKVQTKFRVHAKVKLVDT